MNPVVPLKKPRKNSIPEDLERAAELLHYAIIMGMYELVQVAIIAYKEKHDDVRQLLEYPCEEFYLCTALQLAVRHHHKKGCGCYVAILNNDKPCNDFIKHDNKAKIVGFLLENGADPNVRDSFGLTAAQFSVQPNLYFSDPVPELIPLFPRPQINLVPLSQKKKFKYR